MLSNTPVAIAARKRYAYIKAHRPAKYKAILENAATYRHPTGKPRGRKQMCFCDACRVCVQRELRRRSRALLKEDLL